MIHSNEENKRWWSGLGKSGQAELITKVEDKASSGRLQDMIRTVKAEVAAGRMPTSNQLDQLRKWA